jgi:ubiquinone/menaquinone biosynthesis C-methylase UbiE
MRNLAYALLALLLLATFAHADDYRDTLEKDYPFVDSMTGMFTDMYPAMARQIVQDFGITEGVCVDAGGGCGCLAMELAKITDLTIYVLDIDPGAVGLCNLMAREAGLQDRVRGVQGDGSNMLFRDSFADLVISQNSIFFWPDIDAGIRECYRILKPGGAACVGGGFSRLMEPEAHAKLVKWARDRVKEHPDSHMHMDSKGTVERAHAAGIADISILEDFEFEWWVIMRK